MLDKSWLAGSPARGHLSRVQGEDHVFNLKFDFLLICSDVSSGESGHARENTELAFVAKGEHGLVFAAAVANRHV